MWSEQQLGTVQIELTSLSFTEALGSPLDWAQLDAVGNFLEWD